MRITSTTSGLKGGSNPRRAVIEKQIRRLEEKKKALMKKLNGQTESSSSQAANLGQATVQVNNQPIASQGVSVSVAQTSTAAANQTASAGNGSGAAAAAVDLPMAPVGSDSVQSMAENLYALRQALSSGQGGGGGTEMPESLEDTMKQIQMLDMQIMTLQQQLGEDAMMSLSMTPDGEDADLASLVSNAVAAKTTQSELPQAEVNDGHVDGYA